MLGGYPTVLIISVVHCARPPPCTLCASGVYSVCIRKHNFPDRVWYPKEKKRCVSGRNRIHWKKVWA